jgi:hypothetical protein
MGTVFGKYHDPDELKCSYEEVEYIKCTPSLSGITFIIHAES